MFSNFRFSVILVEDKSKINKYYIFCRYYELCVKHNHSLTDDSAENGSGKYQNKEYILLLKQ